MKKNLSFLFSLWALLALLLTFALLGISSLFWKIEEVSQLRLKTNALKQRSELLHHSRNVTIKLQEKLQKADRYYLDKWVENKVLLEPEQRRLQALNPIPSSSLGQRLKFLKENNQLRFTEQNFQKKPPFQEVEEKQQHSVEMDEEDLKCLLARLEDRIIGNQKPGENPPLFTITEFELSKKRQGQEETFLVNMTLLKRELIHEK